MTTDRRPKDEASAVVSCRPRRQPWSRRRASINEQQKNRRRATHD